MIICTPWHYHLRKYQVYAFSFELVYLFVLKNVFYDKQTRILLKDEGIIIHTWDLTAQN